MRILFDHQAFEMQRIGGISRSYAELISHLRNEGCNAIVGLKESDNIHLRGNGLATGIKPLHYSHKLLFEGRKLFKGQRTLTRKVLESLGHENDCLQVNQEYCVKLLKKQQFDVFEPTFFELYFLPYLKGKPFVITVHDMIPELFPQYFPRDYYQIVNKKTLSSLATAIHVPSHQTKNDLVNILNIKPEKITVIWHGTSQISVPETEPQRPIDKPYLLFIGERGGYKNFTLLLHELAILVQTEPDLNLICTGRPFVDDEQRLMSDLGLTEHVHHCFATDDILYALYHHAVGFVYPSAYEGFGLPILEAFTCGCPVLLNNASCFPEVGGNAAIYFDINRKGDLADHVIALLRCGNDERQQIIARGIQRTSLFSWEESAKKLKKVYETICHKQ